MRHDTSLLQQVHQVHQLVLRFRLTASTACYSFHSFDKYIDLVLCLLTHVHYTNSNTNSKTHGTPPILSTQLERIRNSAILCYLIRFRSDRGAQDRGQQRYGETPHRNEDPLRFRHGHPS